MTIRRWACVAAVLAVAMVTACGPSSDFPPWSAPLPDDRIALHHTESGQFEILLAPCTPVEVTRLELVGPVGLGDDLDTVPRIWQVEFRPPVSDLRTVTIGVVPPGGTESVSWEAAELPPLDTMVAVAHLADGTTWRVAMPDEGRGSVRFLAEDFPFAEFQDRSRC